jgi:hypothetical protein
MLAGEVMADATPIRDSRIATRALERLNVGATHGFALGRSAARLRCSQAARAPTRTSCASLHGRTSRISKRRTASLSPKTFPRLPPARFKITSCAYDRGAMNQCFNSTNLIARHSPATPWSIEGGSLITSLWPAVPVRPSRRVLTFSEDGSRAKKDAARL